MDFVALGHMQIHHLGSEVVPTVGTSPQVGLAKYRVGLAIVLGDLLSTPGFSEGYLLEPGLLFQRVGVGKEQVFSDFHLA